MYGRRMEVDGTPLVWQSEKGQTRNRGRLSIHFPYVCSRQCQSLLTTRTNLLPLELFEMR